MSQNGFRYHSTGLVKPYIFVKAQFWQKVTVPSCLDHGFKHPMHLGLQQSVGQLVPPSGTNNPKSGHWLMEDISHFPSSFIASGAELTDFPKMQGIF